MLTVIIVILMIALLGTLGAGLVFLMMDRGDVKKMRLVNSLRLRVGSPDRGLQVRAKVGV